MVAFSKETRKRFTLTESDAVALGQCIHNAIEHLSPPDCIAESLLNIIERLAKQFGLDMCPSCGCVARCGEDCHGEED